MKVFAMFYPWRCRDGRMMNIRTLITGYTHSSQRSDHTLMDRQTVSIHDLYHIKAISSPRFSPDGKEAIFLQTVMCEEKDTYFTQLFHYEGDGDQLRQWTFQEERISSPAWSPCGRYIAFLSDRTGVSQIYRMARGGGEPERMTDCPSSVKQFLWSPCSTKIVFSMKLGAGEDPQGKMKEEERPRPYVTSTMKYKGDGEGLRDHRHSQLVILDIITGKAERLSDDHHDYSLQDWSPDGKELLVTADLSDDPDFSFQQHVYTWSIETGRKQRITGGAGQYGTARWSPDGRHIAYTGDEREYFNATQPKLWIYNVEARYAYCLSEGLDLPIGDYMNSDAVQAVQAPGIKWSTDNESVYFLASDSGNTVLYYGHIDGAIFPAYLEAEQHVYDFDFHPQGQRIIMAMSTPSKPGELYLLHVPTGAIRQLTTTNEHWTGRRNWAEIESFYFQGAKGEMVQGWLMKPAGAGDGRKFPLVVEIHGGPHTMYGNTFFHELQVLAGDYAVLFINPRGSHGYGQAFADAVRGDYGGGDYEDIMKAVDHVLEHFSFLDENRMGVTGGSYGGFMTNWIIGHTGRFKAAITQRSISNWISFYGVSDIGYSFTEWQIGSGLEDMETLWRRSPLAYVGEMATPLLIMHSEEDLRCPIEQAEQLYIALKRQKKEARFVRFPQSDHNLSRTGAPSLRVHRLNEMMAWFEKHL